MFTNRFIKFPIRLYDTEHKELTGEELTKNTNIYINPFEIISYRPSDENDGNCVFVTLKNGDTLLIYMSMNRFEQTLNEHMKQST